MDLIGGDGRGMLNRRRATHGAGDGDGDGGKKKRRVVDLELDVFHNPKLCAYPEWEQQPQPWSVATAMKYVGFLHSDRLWPPNSHGQHCKSKDAKYLHLEDVEVEWQFLTILRAISKQTKWPKGSIPRSIASMMYVEHVLCVNVDWSTFCTESFGAIGQGLLAKLPFHIPYVPVSEWFRNDPKLYMEPRAQERTALAVGGAQRADGSRGQVDDGLALSEWESFVGLVAPVAEEVQTTIDATMEALCQQHDIDVQAYKARIDHLETMLASLGIRELVELLPSTGGASTLQSIQDDQYTTDMFTENQGLHQNLEDADRVNAGLQEDLDNANRANVGLRVDLDHANRTNVELHATLVEKTNELREQESLAWQKSNDHSQLLERFQALNVELQDAKHRLGMLHDMVLDGEALHIENDKCKRAIKELWADIKSMKLGTILAIARARQYEAEFDSIMEEWNRNARLRSHLLTSWPLEETMYIPEWAADAYQAPSGSLYWHLIEDETHNFDAEKQYDYLAHLRGTKMWPNPHPMVADGSRCILCQNPFGLEGCFMVGSCGAQFQPPCLISCMIKKRSCPHCR